MYLQLIYAKCSGGFAPLAQPSEQSLMVAACIVLLHECSTCITCMHAVLAFCRSFLVTCHATRTTAICCVHFPVQRSGCIYFRRFAVTMEYQFEASVDTKQTTLNLVMSNDLYDSNLTFGTYIACRLQL